MPLARPFAQIDVFSAVPCAGNPVAVVLDGQGLDAAAMHTLFNGGSIYALPQAEMPANSPVVAILRY